MNRCKTCEWWIGDWLDEGWKRCTSPKIANRADDPKLELPYPATDGIYSGNTHDHKSYIATGPDFGCVNWEERGAY